MRYLSVCSGIEAATVAWHQHGFEPLAFSEIEKFPRRVLEHHYPDVPLHGDFTALREQEWIGDADMLVGGTPCQAFSVAGLRNSLEDDRGNLTLEFVRLADAIDDLRPVGCGTIIVWENVPGVLSVKDNAFGCFLGALVGNDDPIIPTGGKWTSAGMVVGPKRSAAWRVLDAQYFGVAQRRRRVFVVASSRDGFDPAEVLFEREGVRRDTPPSREQGQEVAATVAARFGISRNNHEEVITQSVGEVSPTLTKEGTGVVRTGFQEDGWYVATCFDRQRSDEYGTDDVASTMSARDYKAATDLVAQPVAFGVGENPDLGHCLRSGASKADKHESTTYVAQPVTQFGDIAGTLSARHDSSPCVDRGQNMVAKPVAKSHWDGDQYPHPTLSQSLKSSGGVGASNQEVFAQRGAYLAPAIMIHGTQDPIISDIAFPPGRNSGRENVLVQPVTYSIMPQNSGKDYKAREVDVAQPIMASGPSGGNQGGDYVMHSMAVRRLTPVECERLQGFPDNYTNIPNSVDGPRYKALGNSMAVPVMAWIGKRIAREVAA